MEQDKALQKALRMSANHEPAMGFEQHIMQAIQNEAKKKKAREQFYSIGLVAFVSLILIIGTIFVLKQYSSFSFSISLPKTTIVQSTHEFIGPCVFIAALVLILLCLDVVLRQRFIKHINNDY